MFLQDCCKGWRGQAAVFLLTESSQGKSNPHIHLTEFLLSYRWIKEVFRDETVRKTSGKTT